MKAVILAGGLGTRMGSETEIKPKPMVEIGGKPIMWHIMKIFRHHGIKDFAIALGYRGDYIKRYMIDSASLGGNLQVDFATGKVSSDLKVHEDWSVELVDTGGMTHTGGRLKRMKKYLQDGTFMMTYGDGVADVDITKLVDFHKSHGKLATVTAVRPPARFGRLAIEDGKVDKFSEKNQMQEGWINGGYFVLEPPVLDLIDHDDMAWEREPLERLAEAGELMAFQHDSFWQCMDAVRDKMLLERLWTEGDAPWKVWE